MKIKRPNTQQRKIIIAIALQTSNVIPTLGDATCTDLDIIVKLTDLNPQTLRRLDLDAYTNDFRNNRRRFMTSKEHFMPYLLPRAWHRWRN
ncbi:unnamed protein product [Eruca vesicaria subsp. sativa]|uniref:Uncharacterized protein n=1 Tax=Eruca vesicaria subsp. sativa TaxID=29727 RepID=A0ABC8KW03_ERUVS|nr:unnamed protein product [Eruca vesicaria subsp. sativa]